MSRTRNLVPPQGPGVSGAAHQAAQQARYYRQPSFASEVVDDALVALHLLPHLGGRSSMASTTGFASPGVPAACRSWAS